MTELITNIFKFSITKLGPQSARRGQLITPHGCVETPAFIFCATKAGMKSLTIPQLRATNTQIILSNTYHLMLQPGSETVHHFGGLQQFTGWRGPMLTDSGGFQIFSLGHGTIADEIKGRRNEGRPKTLLKIDEEGALFRSYINGKQYLLTPEESIRVQRNLGADLIVVLDECTPYHVDKTYTQESMERSHRWALRSLAAHQQFEASGQYQNPQRLYGIIQGGTYSDLRKISADFVNENSFFGHAIGGSLGASKEEMYEVVAETMSYLSKDRPTHLLGIGGIRDIFEGVLAGIDTFDCVHPTRIARHGAALVKPWNRPEGLDREHLNLKNTQFKLDDSPIEPDCFCNTCRNYSRGYLYHLLRTEIFLAFTLIAEHNAYFMNDLMQRIRDALETDSFLELYKGWGIQEARDKNQKGQKVQRDQYDQKDQINAAVELQYP